MSFFYRMVLRLCPSAFAEAYKWYTAQMIPKMNPKEIAVAFHGGGTEIAEKGHFKWILPKTAEP